MTSLWQEFQRKAVVMVCGLDHRFGIHSPFMLLGGHPIREIILFLKRDLIDHTLDQIAYDYLQYNPHRRPIESTEALIKKIHVTHKNHPHIYIGRLSSYLNDTQISFLNQRIQFATCQQCHFRTYQTSWMNNDNMSLNCPQCRHVLTFIGLRMKHVAPWLDLERDLWDSWGQPIDRKRVKEDENDDPIHHTRRRIL